MQTPMASEQQVKQYLAYWFQLGKPVLIRGGQQRLLPNPVIQGDRYSSEFEQCWQQVRSAHAGDCYLEGTLQTIEELLSEEWQINPCSRCSMPVPVKDLGVNSPECPCADIPDWPNPDLPQPRDPVSTAARLGQLRDRLRQVGGSIP